MFSNSNHSELYVRRGGVLQGAIFFPQLASSNLIQYDSEGRSPVQDEPRTSCSTPRAKSSNQYLIQGEQHDQPDSPGEISL